MKAIIRQSIFHGRVIPCCISLSMLFAVVSNAEPMAVNNGDFEGTHVTYFDVTQNSPIDPIPAGQPGPYGQPEIEGDDLVFDAPSFAAIADLDRLLDTTDGFMSFLLEADEGHAVTDLALYEFGAIEFHSSSGGSVRTWTNVVAPVFMEIKQVVVADGTPQGQVMAVPDRLFFSRQIEITPFGNSPPGWNSLEDPNETKWFGELEVDLVAAIASAFPELVGQHELRGVASMMLTMNNVLSAGAENTTSLAFIDKKHSSFRPEVVAAGVPEPGSWLNETLLLALAVGGSLARRGRRAK
jgi:hypothetical protein